MADVFGQLQKLRNDLDAIESGLSAIGHEHFAQRPQVGAALSCLRAFRDSLWSLDQAFESAND